MIQTSEFSVYDVVAEEMILERVPKEAILDRLHIAATTLYACIAEDRLCRKRYKIIPLYQEKRKSVPDDLRQAWYAMQRLFGVEVPEADE